MCSAKPKPRYIGESVENLEAARVLQINDKIISAAAKSLVLLADEYKIALQAKHWTEGKDEEVAANIRFLVSVINDSHRLSYVHTEPLKDVETGQVVLSHLLGDISTCFNSVVESAASSIVRVIFTDLEK